MVAVVGSPRIAPQVEDSHVSRVILSGGTVSLYEIAQNQWRHAAELMELEPWIIAILTEPKNEIRMNFPVVMDTGKYRLFKGYRVQHNNILGPYKGGMRYHPQVDIDEIKALASWMAFKCALANLPRKGRRRVESEGAQPGRADADHPPLCPFAR
jgi:hypothetical protein